MCDEKVPEYGRNMLGGCRHKAYRNVRKRWYKGAKEISKFCRLMVITSAKDKSRTVKLQSRIDTADEVEYFLNGGILQYVLRQLAA